MSNLSRLLKESWTLVEEQQDKLASYFYARLFLGLNGKEVEVDSRPSDAIALAVRMSCPILVAQEVLDKAGVFPEKEEEEEKLSIFKELVNSMDLPDLEGPPPEKS